MVEVYDNMQSYQLKHYVIKDDLIYEDLLNKNLFIMYNYDDIIYEILTIFEDLNDQELRQHMMNYLL